MEIDKIQNNHYGDIFHLIEESRAFVANTTNKTSTLLYWQIGSCINGNLLDNQRAEYGKQSLKANNYPDNISTSYVISNATKLYIIIHTLISKAQLQCKREKKLIFKKVGINHPKFDVFIA